MDEPTSPTSPFVPFAAVNCFDGCGLVEIDHAEYSRQMARPDALWQCPTCGSEASFDDDTYERLQLGDPIG